MFERIKATLRAYRVEYDVFFNEAVAARRHAQRDRARHRAAVRARATSTAPRARCGCARPTSATTRTASSSARPARRRTSPPTSPTPRTSSSAASTCSSSPLGSDHHGYVARMKANMAALGVDPDRLEIPILQFVHIVEGGSRASMSKRRGEFITLDELIAEIGVDATRYFMLSRSNDSTIDLDLDLARSQSAENPVYYVQYAHARIASVRRKAGEERVPRALATTGLDVDAAPLRARAGQEAARLPGGGRRGRRAARAAPHRRLRARPRAGLHGLLPRLPGRGRRAGRARGLAPAPVGRHPADDRPRPRPARASRRPTRCEAVACNPGAPAGNAAVPRWKLSDSRTTR